jgi:hypothetical protein
LAALEQVGSRSHGGIRKCIELTWIAPGAGQQSPLKHALAEIELDHGSPKYEVIIPTMATRVKKTHERAALYIERTDIAPLP